MINNRGGCHTRKEKQMSPELANLIEAIKILSALRVDVAGLDFAWHRINSAEKYLQKQVAPHFAE